MNAAPGNLVVSNISKTFGGRVALERASLEVIAGSVTGVIGPNGSGKSTLFNIVAGTLKPDVGRITYREQDLTKLILPKSVAWVWVALSKSPECLPNSPSWKIW